MRDRIKQEIDNILTKMDASLTAARNAAYDAQAAYIEFDNNTLAAAARAEKELRICVDLIGQMIRIMPGTTRQ